MHHANWCHFLVFSCTYCTYQNSIHIDYWQYWEKKFFYINMNADFIWKSFMTIGTTPTDTCILTWSSWSAVPAKPSRHTYCRITYLSEFELKRWFLVLLQLEWVIKKIILKFIAFYWNKINFFFCSSSCFLNMWMWRTPDHEYIDSLLATSCHCGKAAGTGPHIYSWLARF